MARPPQDAIDTFISITGAPEAIAVQKLEEHGGDLNEAVNAHFSEGDRMNAYTSSGPAAQNDFMDTDDLIDVDASVPAHSLLSAAHNLNPFSLINSSSGQRFFDGGASEFSNRVPQVSHPREVREVPIEFKDGNSRHGSSSHGPTIEEVTGSIPAHGPEVDGHVIIDDEDEDLPSAPTDQPDEFDDISRGRRPGPNFTPLSNVSDYGNDIEEEMIRAAIEASKRDTMASASQQLDFPNAAEEEKVLRELGLQVGEQSFDPLGIELEELERAPTANGRSLLNNAKELAAKKDTAGLEALSNSEVEKFMSQWSNSKAFRDDYERRILTSLNSRQLSRDGRMRNPDEKPIIVETPAVAKLDTPPLKVTPGQGKEAVKLPSSEDIVSSSKNQGEELTKSAKPDAGRNISNTEEIGKAHEDEPPKELSKSKEIDPAILKEMKREEEIAKAKLAMERKKKLAEKAAAKAEARALKEAEKKLKQKEKKAKKKAGTSEPASTAEQTETETKTEEPEEADVKLDSPVSEAKPQKLNVKYRNRPKAKEQQLPRVILKKKKSHSYGYYAAPAAIFALLLAVVGYYYFGRI